MLTLVAVLDLTSIRVGTSVSTLPLGLPGRIWHNYHILRPLHLPTPTYDLLPRHRLSLACLYPDDQGHSVHAALSRSLHYSHTSTRDSTHDDSLRKISRKYHLSGFRRTACILWLARRHRLHVHATRAYRYRYQENTLGKLGFIIQIRRYKKKYAL